MAERGSDGYLFYAPNERMCVAFFMTVGKLLFCSEKEAGFGYKGSKLLFWSSGRRGGVWFLLEGE